MSSAREDIGYVHDRKPGKRPPTDGEVVRKWAGFEGCRDTGDDLTPWCVTLRRVAGERKGKRLWFFGQTETEALSRARRWIETEGG